ncbi:MAG: DNA-3-methyladenine glycosylase [Actinomycetota bacterium]
MIERTTGGLGSVLPRRWYDRDSVAVARDLLGRVLVRSPREGELLVVRIVETEAYRFDDPASHSFRGPTPRTRVMFGPPGRVYVYFTYGMHFCMNVVTGAAGTGCAVLLRAAEPIDGLDEMARRRGTDASLALCSGPARLCQALGVDRTLDGTDLVRGDELQLRAGRSVPRDEIVVGTRVGIRSGVDRSWRFRVRESPFTSRARGAGDPRPRVRSRTR